MKLLTKSISKT